MCVEHFAPLLEQIAKLEEALYNIQFEQHWLEAQTDRQAIGIICNLVSFLNEVLVLNEHLVLGMMTFPVNLVQYADL